MCDETLKTPFPLPCNQPLQAHLVLIALSTVGKAMALPAPDKVVDEIIELCEEEPNHE